MRIDPKAEQFEQVVACADQRPFAVHLLQSPQQELPESPALLDLAEYRRNGATVELRPYTSVETELGADVRALTLGVPPG